VIVSALANPKLERLVIQVMSARRVPYAVIATRALALAIDVAIVQVIVFSAGAVLARSSRR
jgi:hypothetical protein